MGQGSPQSSSQERTTRTDREAPEQVQRGVTRTNFGRKYRLRKRHEIARVRNSGRLISVPLLRAWRTDGASTHPRVAIIVALHGNSAVARNRLRRRLWHVVRTEILTAAGRPFDMVISARSAAYSAGFEALSDSIKKALAV
jgi:ribonuclease P protein component